MMGRPNRTGMSRAMISRSCANFLADFEIYPGHVQSGGAITRTGNLRIRFGRHRGGRSEVDSRVRDHGLVSGFLVHRRGQVKATLELKFERCLYREHLNGASTLTLFDVSLPTTVCTAYSAGSRRLCDIIDFSDDERWFFIRANPVVHAIRNVVRLQSGRRGKPIRKGGLLFTMVDDWSHDVLGFLEPGDRGLDQMP